MTTFNCGHEKTPENTRKVRHKNLNGSIWMGEACVECNRTKSRVTYKALKKKDEANRAKCRHCHEAVVSRPKGLCSKCSRDPAIIDLYPSDSVFCPHKDNMTMEELDALVAEQYPTMPGNEEGQERPEPYRIPLVKIPSRSRMKSKYLS
jgi:hypothetical protein